MRVIFHLKPSANQDNTSYPTLSVSNVPEDVAHRVAREIENNPNGVIHEEYTPTDGATSENAFSVKGTEVIAITIKSDVNRGGPGVV